MIECIICFDNIKTDDKIVQCKKCNTLFHKNCYKRWNNIKKDNKCIYCMSKNTIINTKININIEKRNYCIYYCNIL